ncbi:thionin-like protein [Arabidopsis thaliana]|uniref:AT1G25275 protein n=1 Tax=Arabidopsis thaliana TaxID=3702 RepID=B9DG55_ARATH|nr:thionin-like protein [Arabidopsis thaliana]AEE30598.1 thionin-like protein [Arabidopsis thaliana]BAH19722.1 AT1G25275 [Arabidopsis thaliana]|eukprot:NP_001031090.1 thionin-like protein [Arabidopsis thaliana]
MMKKQVTIVAALLIMMALCSSLNMVAEAQLGPGDCYDGCSTACVQRDPRKTSRCDRKCSIRCGPGKHYETGYVPTDAARASGSGV